MKLEGVLPADAPDLPWLRARLLPLVGAGGEPASQEESFTAWRRVLESWAAERETVLVFEDLHWADEALLSFLEHLADWAEGVPLLVLCTARPELYEQHPGFGANARNAHRINLAPLERRGDRRPGLVVAGAGGAAGGDATGAAGAGWGNPLYAEEFVRLLADRGELAGAGEVPDSVQALIAARLDTLSVERKRLLQDASVLGKVFWAGALCEMGGRDPQEVTQSLHELSRKELVRPARPVVDGGGGRVRLLPSARPRCRLRPDPPRRPHGQAPLGRNLARAEGGRAGRGPGRCARLPLPDRARARAGGRRHRSGRRAGGTIAPLPGVGR